MVFLDIKRVHISNLLHFKFTMFPVLGITIKDFREQQHSLQMGLPQAQIGRMSLPVLEYDSSPMNKPDVQQQPSSNSSHA